MALLLRLRRPTTTVTPLLHHHHLFSTSNSGDDDNNANQPPPDSNPSFSSDLNKLRNALKLQQPPSNTTPPSQSFRFEDIKSKIQGYRSRSSDLSPSKAISFQEIYNKNVNLPRPATSAGGGGGGRPTIPFDTIRGSLRQLQDLKGSQSSAPAMGGFSESLFRREIKDTSSGDGNSASAFDFVKSYRHDELGARLRELRPEVKGDEWFSIGELNERLKKVRENDDLKSKSTPFGECTMVVREALTNIEAQKQQPSSGFNVDMLALLGGTSAHSKKPAQEHLLEKYLHPDNMSSAEKLKIELARVRDEFKMSESDCGSSRVQVAQLTTKIKHLSSMLHKKDKHSRKGLLAMVQKRKKILKYLRKTDWESYCFVLSKLGLRDNPEHTYKARTGKPGEVGKTQHGKTQHKKTPA